MSTPTRSHSLSTRLLLVAATFYAALALCALYSIVFTTGTHVAGFDFFNYHWNFWFIRHVFTTPVLNLYLNDFAMFPAVSNYGYHALAAFWYPLWALVEPMAGTLAAVNLILFLGCFLNGFLTFAWLKTEGVGTSWALIGGAALQIFPIARYFYYNTHLNLMDWFWLPALLLLWRQIERAAGEGSWGRLIIWATIFGLGIWGLGHTDLQFPIFAAFVLIPVGLRTLYRARRNTPALLRLFVAGGLALVVGVGLLWTAGPLPSMLTFRARLEPGAVEDRPGIPLPGGFLNMAAGWWNWNEPSVGAFATLYIVAALAIALFVRSARRRDNRRDDRWFWFACMLPPLLFALGPTLQVGDSALPLPYRAMHALTSGMFRMPWRLAPVALLCGVMFAGYVFTSLSRRWRVPARAFATAGAVLALAASVRLFEPAPLQAAPADFAFYHRVGEETGDALDRQVVLEVPTAAGTGEVLFGDPRAIQLQWYGMAHEKRMVNGFISRAPVDPIWYIVQDDPMMAWLGGRRLLEPERVAEQLQERVFEWPIGYVVVHASIIGAESSTLTEVVSYLNAQDETLCPPLEETALDGAGQPDTIIAYRTRWHPAGCSAPFTRTPPMQDGVYVLDLGATGDWPYLGAGWHYREPVGGLDWRWTGAPNWAGAADTAAIYVDLPPGEYTIIVWAQAFVQARTVQVWANGRALGERLTIAPDVLGDYAVQIGADDFTDGGALVLTFVADGAQSPQDANRSGDTRPLSIAVERVTFAPVD